MEYTVPHILRLARRYPRLHELLARPEASAGLCFTQDKVQVLWDLFEEANDADVRYYLDSSADTCQLLWRYGIQEESKILIIRMKICSAKNMFARYRLFKGKPPALIWGKF